MDDTTILGGTLNQLGQTVKQAAKQAVKIPEEMAADLGGQIGVSAPLRQGFEGQAKPAVSGEPKQWKSDKERVKFLRSLYGSAEQNSSSEQNLLKESAPSADASASIKTTADKKTIANKEEQKKLLELRNQLHKEVYYDPTFNPVKKQEERPAEKVEKEKKQEMAELEQKEAKKPTNWAVVREQNKAEVFRGASG